MVVKCIVEKVSYMVSLSSIFVEAKTPVAVTEGAYRQHSNFCTDGIGCERLEKWKGQGLCRAQKLCHQIASDLVTGYVATCIVLKVIIA